MKENLRIYGSPPYRVALLHGGPGAAGSMAPLARELAVRRGVMEPLQTAYSIDGQVEELRAVLQEFAEPPVALAGHAWGAWLGFIFAARYPRMVGKLILISSGAFDVKFSAPALTERISRLNEEERGEVYGLLENLGKRPLDQNAEAFSRLADIFLKVDTYDPLSLDIPEVDFNLEIYRRVWGEATELRRSGRLLRMGKDISCPVVAIHGDYDTQSAEGVEKPLSTVLRDFRLILLKNCGHKPWIERQARELFFAIMDGELALTE